MAPSVILHIAHNRVPKVYLIRDMGVTGSEINEQHIK